MTKSAPAIVESRDDRRKRLARERQARRRERCASGRRLWEVPAEIADEIDASTDEEFAAKMAALYAKSVKSSTA